MVPSRCTGQCFLLIQYQFTDPGDTKALVGVGGTYKLGAWNAGSRESRRLFRLRYHATSIQGVPGYH